MKLIVLGSSSKGNCYVMTNGVESLIIEAGVKWSEVKQIMGYNISNIAGVIISHEHGDHAGHVKEYIAAGIRVYSQAETLESLKIASNHYTTAVTPMKKTMVGGFTVIPLSVEHDVPCVAYLINHAGMGLTLFVTDTFIFDYVIKDLHHILIEANYADDILDYNIEKGHLPVMLRKRLMTSHMEIGTTKKVLLKQNLSKVRDITLIHLSDGNSDAIRFTREIEKATGRPTSVADAGMEIDFDDMPF